jgi:hypothetical protein
MVKSAGNRDRLDRSIANNSLATIHFDRLWHEQKALDLRRHFSVISGLVKRRLLVVAALLCSAAALLTPLPPPGQAGAVSLRPIATVSSSSFGWFDGEAINVHSRDGELRLTGERGFLRAGRRMGFYTSSVRATDDFFDIAGLTSLNGDAATGAVEVELRSAHDGEHWSSWVTLPLDGRHAMLPAGRFYQYRVELSSPDSVSPVVRDLQIELASMGSAPAAGTDNPTARVFGSREGLVGGRTANGHQIVQKDRFAALPSKKALNPLDKRDYQVRITYRGKSTTVPVWDVGPWNTKDNYWDDQRELFQDLPRFMPQAQAAWQNDYNGGRDQFNRWVSFPASIDIADGAFIDDLGMTRSDWVDVTFLWVNASSPAVGETPAVTGLKPERRQPGQQASTVAAQASAGQGSAQPAVPPVIADVAPSAAPAQAAGQTWYFAEGNTRSPFETWFVLRNLSDDDARVSLNYMASDGSQQRQELSLEGNERVSVRVNDTLQDAEFSTRIESSQPLAAERTLLFGPDGHSSSGVTAPATTWYLADGSTQQPFDTWLLVQNPGGEAANLVITFMLDGADVQTASLSVSPSSRRSVRANQYVTSAGFATRVTSDKPIVVEQATYLAYGGGLGTMAAPAADKTWYLAEGSTQKDFDTWLLVENPNRVAANVTVTYLREKGDPAVQNVSVGAASRIAINAREMLAGERFGARVEADQPVVVQRSSYFGGAADGKGTGSHGSIGATELSRRWYLTGVPSQPGLTEQILVANPGDSSAHLTVRFARDDGDGPKREYDLKPRSRLTIDVNRDAGEAGMSADVSADEPIVVERSAYYNGRTGGLSSLGIPR